MYYIIYVKTVDQILEFSPYKHIFIINIQSNVSAK